MVVGHSHYDIGRAVAKFLCVKGSSQQSSPTAADPVLDELRRLTQSNHWIYVLATVAFQWILDTTNVHR